MPLGRDRMPRTPSGCDRALGWPIDGARRFSGMGLRVLQRHLEVSLGLLSLDRREPLEKSVDSFPGFQVVDQGLDGNASACKHKFSAEHVGIARNDTFGARGTVSARERRNG